jgi:CDGSH-type Zn-finger protein
VTIYGADGTAGFGGDTCRLCRCGSSLDKPFCDSSHRKIGFTT